MNPSLQSFLNLVISFLVVFGLFTLVTMKRGSTEGLRAHLFFPKGTQENNKTPDYHESHLNHRLIVNHKTSPPIAYILSPGSYGWSLVKKHKGMLVNETDSDPDDPKFSQEWCKERDYVLSPEVPERKYLLFRGRITKRHSLDPKYKHMRYEGFFPFYCYVLPMMIKGVPHRRILMNVATKKAFPMDAEQWYWAISGRIDGHMGIASPRLHHAQKWAEEQKPPFKWVQFPKKDEVFSKKTENGANIEK